MIFDLPRDLVEEILSRVPLKSKKAVRSTCKKWDSYLTKMHQCKLAAEAKEGESRTITLIDGNIYLTSIVVNENPSAKHLGKLTCLGEQVKISQVFHCEGLLLCILQDDDTKVVVWNPYWGQTRWIETRYPNRKQSTLRYRYALGCVNNKKNKSLGCYKIFRFLDYAFVGSRYSKYEIYDFDSDDLWKVVDVPSNSVPYGEQKFGVSLKGNTYWCGAYEQDHIICFDFTRERFGPLLHLPFIRYGDNLTLSSVREEKLAALVEDFRDPSYLIGIWITTKIEDEEITWSKFLTVDVRPREGYSMPLWRIFIEEEKKVVIGFEEQQADTLNHHTIRIITGESRRYFRVLELGECEEGQYCWNLNKEFVCSSYVPSLVQI